VDSLVLSQKTGCGGKHVGHGPVGVESVDPTGDTQGAATAPRAPYT
jgi:hypothetical protein